MNNYLEDSIRMKKFASISVDNIFDILGIQLYKHRPTFNVLENNNDFLHINLSFNQNDKTEDSYIITEKKYRMYTGEHYCSTFKQAAVKLYLSLYFFVNSEGVSGEIGYDEFTDLLGVHKKTLLAALKRLEEYGKIYVNYYKYTFSVIIPDYSSMFKSKEELGIKGPHYGYIKLSDVMLKDIIKLQGINAIRCTITALFRALMNQYNSSSKLPAAEIRLQEFNYNMPKYVKPHVIKSALEQSMSFFGVFKERYDKLIFVLSDKYSTDNIKLSIKNEVKKKVNSFIENVDKLNKTASLELNLNNELKAQTNIEITNLGLNPEDIKLSYYKHQNHIPDLIITDNQLENISNLSYEYNIPIIMKGLKLLYTNYVLPGIIIDNIGGMLRSIIKELEKFSPESEEIILA